MPGVQTCALRSEEHTSELQSHDNLVCRLLLEKKEHDPVPVPVARVHTLLEGGAAHAAGAVALLLALFAFAPGNCMRPLFLPVQIFFFKKRAAPEISSFPLHGPLRV